MRCRSRRRFSWQGNLVIAQVANILAWIAPRLALVPRDDSSRVKANQIQLTIADLVAEAHDVHHPSHPASITGSRGPRRFARPHPSARERIPKSSRLARAVPSSATAAMHLVGHHTSYVDLSAFQVVEGLRYAFPHAMRAVAPSVPRLVDLHDRVAQRSRASPRTSRPTGAPLQRGRDLPALSGARPRQPRRRVKKLSTATKSADPTIDQITGKASCPTCQTTSSGKRSPRAIHMPEQRADEAERDRSEAAHVAVPGDGAADGPADTGDDEEEEETDEGHGRARPSRRMAPVKRARK